MLTHPAFVMFLGLVALYAPVAALPSYLPVVSRLPRGDHAKLALGLFLYVSIFALLALWVGEVLLEVLGISTAALTATGGIALTYEGVMLMLGMHGTPPETGQGSGELVTQAAEPSTATAPTATTTWQSVLLVPTTFPLTVGGATFALVVSFAAQAGSIGSRGLLSIAVLGYAAVTGITLFGASLLQRRASARGLALLDRIAGILLTAIAVSLLASGGTRLVVDVLNSLR